MSQHTPARPALPVDEPTAVAIVKTEWNAQFTEPLARQARNRLEELGAQTAVYDVPGAVELTYAARRLTETQAYDAVIVIGCVVRGDTPHFDYVCASVTQGVTAVNAEGLDPIIFGVLTVDSDAQAQERVDAEKGAEWADAAIKMIGFSRRVDDEFDDPDADNLYGPFDSPDRLIPNPFNDNSVR